MIIGSAVVIEAALNGGRDRSENEAVPTPRVRLPLRPGAARMKAQRSSTSTPERTTTAGRPIRCGIPGFCENWVRRSLMA